MSAVISCSICFEPLGPNPVFTPCIHGFHDVCINGWFEQNKNNYVIPCPLCKTDIAELFGPRNVGHENLFEEMINILESGYQARPIMLNLGQPIHGQSIFGQPTRLNNESSNNEPFVFNGPIHFDEIVELINARRQLRVNT